MKQFILVSFTFVCLFLLISCGKAQDTQNEKQITVSLRMIGHKVLLYSGDSTSLVLPILKENDRYRIQFATEFEFNPEDLVSTVDSVVKETNMATSYIVEVENCQTGELIYSFKMDEIEKSDIIPCKSRLQPKSCYSLFITLLETNKTNKINYAIIVALLLLLSLMIFIVWKRNNRSNIDTNLIPLGEYYFDKRNTELIIKDQRIELTSKEGDLLLLLYNAANTTVEREVILYMVWGDEGDYVGRTLDVFISKLRKKLEFDSKVKIVNIRGIGYKLVADI